MVDDDPGIRDVVAEFLTRHGYTVDTAADAAAMERILERGDVDLMVLDVMLPGEDGLSICRRLAGSGPPIIMLSAMGEDTDRIVGLELGADDYLAKPCNPRELRSPAGVVVNLSSGEFSLLRAFVERPQRVLTRDQLLEFARGPDSDAFDRAIDVQISRLRRKLDDGGGGHDLIRTIRNEGYMFSAKVTRS